MGRPNRFACYSKAGVTGRIWGFFNRGVIYTMPGLLTADGMHLSQRGKRVFAQELEGLTDRTLNWTAMRKGKRPDLPLINNGEGHESLREYVLVRFFSLLQGVLSAMRCT